MVTINEQLLRQVRKVEREVEELRRLVDEHFSLGGASLAEDPSVPPGSTVAAAPAPRITSERQMVVDEYTKKKHPDNDAGYVVGDRVEITGDPQLLWGRGWKTGKLKGKKGMVVHHTAQSVIVLLDGNDDQPETCQKRNWNVRKLDNK